MTEFIIYLRSSRNTKGSGLMAIVTFWMIQIRLKRNIPQVRRTLLNILSSHETWRSDIYKDDASFQTTASMALRKMRGRVMRPIVSHATAIIARRSAGMRIENRCPLRYGCRLRSHLHIPVVQKRSATKRSERRT